MKKWIKTTLGLFLLPTMVTPFVLTSCNQETKYTVTFYLNNGTESIYQTVKVVKDKYVAQPDSPKWDNHNFKGWYTNKECTNPFNFATKITSDTHLYAKWVNVFTITFYKNDGTQDIYETSKIEENEYVSKPTDPTRSTYIFKGWYNEAECATEFDFNQKISSNHSVYAKWDGPHIQHYVTFYLNNGTESIYKQEEIAEGGKVSKPLQPARSDYVFDGWYNEQGCTTLFDFTKSITANTSVYAKWIAIGEEADYLSGLNFDKTISNGYIAEATYSLYPLATYSAEAETNAFSACCSTFYKNGFCGRNFEWTYSNIPEVIIHTPANKAIDKYATVGVAYATNFSNPNQLGATGKFTAHKTLPWWTVDGINENGLCVSINEVPNDNKTIYFNQGDNSSKPKLSEVQLVRYLLDYCSSVKDCEEKIKQYNIVGHSGVTNEEHIFVCDKTGDCAEIEFVPISSTDLRHKTPKFYRKGETDSKFENIITNFTMIDYKGDCEKWNDETSSLGPKAEGCERYNILYDTLVTKNTPVTSLDDVLNIMSSVYYTKAYSNTLEDDSKTFWFSEFNYGSNVKTTPHTKTNYQSLVSYWNFDEATWKAKTTNRDSSRFYCTLNSSAYDLNKLELKIVFEENNTISKIFKIARE